MYRCEKDNNLAEGHIVFLISQAAQHSWCPAAFWSKKGPGVQKNPQLFGKVARVLNLATRTIHFFEPLKVG